MAIFVAIAVNEDEYREVLGAAEGMKEDKASWVSFLQWLRGRGLNGVKLVVGDKCQGMLVAVGEVFPDAKYQRCTIHFYRNVFSATPHSKVKLAAKMRKVLHAQESKKAAGEKAKTVVEELRAIKLREAAKKMEDGIEETLTYCDFLSAHYTRIRANNCLERLNREIRRRTRVVGCFPDGNSALMLACARLRHAAGAQWGNKKIHEYEAFGDCSGGLLHCRITLFIPETANYFAYNLDTTDIFYHSLKNIPLKNIKKGILPQKATCLFLKI